MWPQGAGRGRRCRRLPPRIALKPRGVISANPFGNRLGGGAAPYFPIAAYDLVISEQQNVWRALTQALPEAHYYIHALVQDSDNQRWGTGPEQTENVVAAAPRHV
jgi:hypothetical protein